MSAGAKAATRAAASSMASGSPSSRRQISATAEALASLSAKPEFAAIARCANRRPASDSARVASRSSVGSRSGGTRKTTSPAMLSGSRLVASRRRRGQPRSSVFGELGAGWQHVLAVIQDEQEALRAQDLDQLLENRLVRLFDHPQALGHRASHRAWLRERRQLDQQDAIGEVARFGRAVRNLQRETRFARAAWPGQRHDGRFGQVQSNLPQLLLAPDEAAELARQPRC